MSLVILQTQGMALLQHLPSAILNEFTALYRTVNTIPDITTATATNVHTRETIRLARVSVLVTSWTIYLKQQRDNELCLALRKKAKESLSSDATTEAGILLDSEVPATQEQLRDLITREATKIANQQCNDLRNEIENLKKSLYPKSSKKVGWGPPRKQGASPKKNSGDKKSSGPRDRDAPGSGIADQSGDKRDGWTSVCSRNSRQINRQRQPQPQQHHQQQQSRNRDRRAAGSGRGSHNNNGNNERRRLRSRSRIRYKDGGRRINRSSAR
jgi:hypothetical protein